MSPLRVLVIDGNPEERETVLKLLLVGFHKQFVAHFRLRPRGVLAGVRWNRLVMRTVAAGNLKLDTWIMAPWFATVSRQTHQTVF